MIDYFLVHNYILGTALLANNPKVDSGHVVGHWLIMEIDEHSIVTGKERPPESFISFGSFGSNKSLTVQCKTETNSLACLPALCI